MKWKQCATLWSGHEDTSGWWWACVLPILAAHFMRPRANGSFRLFCCVRVCVCAHQSRRAQMQRSSWSIWRWKGKALPFYYMSLDLKETNWRCVTVTSVRCIKIAKICAMVPIAHIFFLTHSFIYWFMCTSEFMCTKQRAGTYIITSTLAPSCSHPSLYLFHSLCPSCDCAE